MKRIIAVFICLLVFASFGTAKRRRGKVFLGTRSAARKGVDRDVFTVGTHRGKFRKIRFNVAGRSVHIRRIYIYYGNGRTYKYNLNRIYAAGSGARIDLQGYKRYIKKVVFYYKTVGRRRYRRQAKISLWGIR